MGLAALLSLALAQAPSNWRYEVPSRDDALHRPPLRSLPLAKELPSDWTLDTEFAGTFQRFGAIRFGDADSPRVALVLDQRVGTDVDLYVDLNRDMVIDRRDRIEGPGPVWEIALDASSVDAAGRNRMLPRRLSVELGPTGAVLGIATLGGLVGQVEVEGRALRCLRRDGDANGLFSDADDQLWIDLDDDGEFEALGELFLVQPVLQLQGRRYRVRTDRLSTDLKLEWLEGTGSVRLVACNGRALAPGADVQVVLTSREGDIIALRSAELNVEVPTGSYRIATVIARFPDPAGGDSWSFVFSETDPARDGPWHELALSATLELDPLAGLEFKVGRASDAGELAAGSRLVLRPELTSTDGLRIVTACRGEPQGGLFARTLRAQVRLFDTHSKERAHHSSGFG